MRKGKQKTELNRSLTEEKLSKAENLALSRAERYLRKGSKNWVPFNILSDTISTIQTLLKKALKEKKAIFT